MPAWLAPMLASMAASGVSSAVQNATSRGGQQGYDLPMMQNSPYDAENMRLMSQMAQTGALNYEAGRLPPGMEILLDRIRKNQLQTSKEEMYGRPGQRGGSIMDNTISMGSRGGVGPKAMMAQGSKAMGDYAQRNSQIRNYMDSLKYSGLQTLGKQSFDQMKSMPRSNELPWTGQAIQQNINPQPGMDLGMGDIDWFDALKPKAQVTPQQLMTQYNTQYPQMDNKANSVIPMTLNGGQQGNMVGYNAQQDPQYNVPAY